MQLISQNLVFNPSFEQTEKCVDSSSLFNANVIGWTTPTLGTTDLFNACSSAEIGVPNNFNGHQVSKFGENYAGCFLYAPNNYREYIQGYFKAPLEKGKKYKVSFYINLADKSDYAIKKISFMLTKNLILTPFCYPITQSQIQHLLTDSFSFHNIDNKRAYNDIDNWVLLSEEIIAKGGERFISIGNFQDNASTKKKKVLKENSNAISYYYFDMVSVELIGKPLISAFKPLSLAEEHDVLSANKIELNRTYVFQNVTFNFDSTALSEAAKTEVGVVYDYLNSNQDTKISICGHTDNMGSKNYNQVLSEKRAKSVAAYLITLGIDKKRIQSFGCGNSQPLSTNKTEEGRKKNRRVEFEIIKQTNVYK